MKSIAIFPGLLVNILLQQRATMCGNTNEYRGHLGLLTRHQFLAMGTHERKGLV